MYKEKYEEVEYIGKGSAGKAIKVIDKITKKEYIAKTVMLGQLNEKEKESAKSEVQYLNRLMC